MFLSIFAIEFWILLILVTSILYNDALSEYAIGNIYNTYRIPFTKIKLIIVERK